MEDRRNEAHSRGEELREDGNIDRFESFINGKTMKRYEGKSQELADH